MPAPLRRCLSRDRVFRVFNGNAEPDVRRGEARAVPRREDICHKRAAFGQHLKRVPVRLFHGVKDQVDKRPRHFLLKQVAHGIDEDTAGLTPAQRLPAPFGPQREIETVLERMAGTPRKRSEKRSA